MSSGFRMNFLSIASSIISLVSIFQPWWGISLSSPIVSSSVLWGLTNQPSNSPGAGVNAAFSQALATYSPIILILVLFSVVMALLGSFSAHRLLLATSLIASIGALAGYLGHQLRTHPKLPRQRLHPTGHRITDRLLIHDQLGPPGRLLHLPSRKRDNNRSHSLPQRIHKNDRVKAFNRLVLPAFFLS